MYVLVCCLVGIGSHQWGGGRMSARRIVYCCLVLLCFAVIGNASAQTAKNAVRAFAKLDARTETGISYRDYVSTLGDVNFELKSFTESSEARKYPEVQKALNHAMLCHLEAKELWGLKFGRYGSQSLPPTSEIAKSLLARYPEAARPLADGGAILVTGNVSIEFLIQHIWKDASRSVENAKRLLSAD